MIPRRRRDELLQLLMIHAQPVRHRLHRLALAIEHEPTQIQLALGPLVRPRQPAEHLRGERHQPRPDLVHLLRSHGPSQDHTTSHIPGSDTPNKALLGLTPGVDTAPGGTWRSPTPSRAPISPPARGRTPTGRAGAGGRRPGRDPLARGGAVT